MNRNRKEIEQRILVLNKKIENIKKRQNELTLRSLLLNSIREELEREKLILGKRLIYSSNKTIAVRQIISFRMNNLEELHKLYLN